MLADEDVRGAAHLQLRRAQPKLGVEHGVALLQLEAVLPAAHLPVAQGHHVACAGGEEGGRKRSLQSELCAGRLAGEKETACAGRQRGHAPDVGRCCAEVGRMMPPVVFSSASATRARTRSPFGITCTQCTGGRGQQLATALPVLALSQCHRSIAPL